MRHKASHSGDFNMSRAAGTYSTRHHVDSPRRQPFADSTPTTDSPLSVPARLFRFLIAIAVFLPLLIVCVSAIAQSISHTESDVENVRFWARTPIWYTLLGALVFTSLTLMNIRRSVSLYLYVMGHELTHAIAILLCGGKIKGIKITATQGGYVLTSKTNIFISLAPYFVPFWLLVWMPAVWAINYFYPFSTYTEWFYAGFGFWLAYHLYWTAYSIIQERQPDLFDNGLLFSVLIVMLINCALLIGVLMLFGIISPQNFAEAFNASAYQLILIICGK